MTGMSDEKVLEQSLRRYKEERDWFQFLLQTLEQLPGEENRLQEKLLHILLDSKNSVIECAEQGKPFIAGYFCNAPEVFHAMDLTWYMLMETPFLAASAPFLVEDIQGSEDMGLGSDLCTAIRLPIYYIETGQLPIPTACLGLIYPCDGAPMLHQVMMHNKGWQNVPVYAADPPYTSDQRAIDYFADELKRMVEFLEKNTGQTLDMKLLKEVCEESNKTYSLWQEYNELRRAVPCPHGWGIGGAQAFAVSQCFTAGDPRCTDWFEQLVKCAELRVEAGEGPEGVEEKIRYLWFDILPYGWVFEVMPWMEEEWGAVLTMDMFGNFPYTLIDTSTEDTIFKGLAKRNLIDAPMIRQARGTAENFSADIRRIVRDYKIDCVIWPGHMGHKDGSAATGIMRETCRELEVPFLHIGLDLFDRRYTSPDEVKDKISKFFTSIT
ncbi:MAG: 2-hydroxyacyl-CoA dehydratase family protein [Dehalococcoidia bacterium]